MNTKSMKSFAKSMFFRYIDDEVTGLSAQLAYNLVLSFFPFIILILTILGYSSIRSEDVLEVLRRVLPSDAFKLTQKTVKDILDEKRFVLLSFGAISSIWATANGLTGVIRLMNKAYCHEEERSFLKVQLLTVICTLGFSLILMVAFAILIFGEISAKFIINYYGLPNSIEIFIDIGRYALGILFLFLSFIALYKITPSKKVAWKEALPGAIFSTLGWVITSVIFSYYVNNFGNYSMVYGSLGAGIILLTWLFLSSIIILVGGEINALLYFKKIGKEKPKGKKY